MCWCNVRFKKASILTPNSEVFAVFVNLKIILSQLCPKILTICSWKVFTHKSKWDVFLKKKMCWNIWSKFIEIFDVTLKMRDKCGEITIYISDKFWNRANPVSNFILSLCAYFRGREPSLLLSFSFSQDSFYFSH